jgi:hypothetical protein
MRSLSRVALLATALALVLAGVAYGGEAPRSASSGNRGALGQRTQGGNHGRPSLDAWLARYWTTILTLPADRNPFFGTGDPCVPLDRKTIAPFVLPPDQPPLTCTVRAGTRVLVIGAIAECSDIEDPPFHAESYSEAITCSQAWIGHLTRHEVIVDGRRRIDLLSGHSGTTSYLTAQLPPNNIFAIDPQPIHFASFGFGVLLPPLRPGRHLITVEQEGQANPEGVSNTFAVTIVVQPPHLD